MLDAEIDESYWVPIPRQAPSPRHLRGNGGIVKRNAKRDPHQPSTGSPTPSPTPFSTTSDDLTERLDEGSAEEDSSLLPEVTRVEIALWISIAVMFFACVCCTICSAHHERIRVWKDKWACFNVC